MAVVRNIPVYNDEVGNDKRDNSESNCINWRHVSMLVLDAMSHILQENAARSEFCVLSHSVTEFWCWIVAGHEKDDRASIHHV